MPPISGPIRIARVLTRPGVGGAARHVALVARELSAPHFENRLFYGPAGKIEGDFFRLHPELAPPHPILVPSLRREAAPAHELRALRDLVRGFRAFSPHIVETHLSKAGILGRLAARLARVPRVIHVFHVNIFAGYDWRPLERSGYLKLERWAARQSDALVSLTDALQAEFLALGIGERAQWHTIRLGLDLEPLQMSASQANLARREIREELALPHDTPLVGLVSRLAPVKSAKTFLEAARLLEHRRPAPHFVLVGDGPSRARLEQLVAEWQLQERVRFLGLRSDMARLYHAFDCVALTSLQEGTPLSILEALAAARPVVATDVGGVSTLIEHEKTGLLVPPRAPQAVAEAIERVLNAPEKALILGKSGQSFVRQNWGVARMAHEYHALYSLLMSR